MATLSQLTRARHAVDTRPINNYRKSIVLMRRTFVAQGRLYQLCKHSTRSKYRGYYIVELSGSIRRYEIKIAKNLTKAQAIAWIHLLKG